MLNGYHRSFNAHALREITRPVDVPDVALGIGWAEATQSLPIHIIYEPDPQLPDLPYIRTLEDASIKGEGSQVSASRFPMTGYMGEALGAWY